MSDAHNDVISDLSDAAAQRANGVDSSDWLTVAQVSAHLNRNEKTIRRMIGRGELTAHKITTPSGQEWRIAPTGTLATAIEAPDGARQGARPTAGQVPGASNGVPDGEPGMVPGITLDTAGHVPGGAGQVPDVQNGQIQAVAEDVHQLRNEIAQLKAFIAGGAMQALNERLANLPDAEQTAQIVAQSVQQAVSQAMAEERANLPAAPSNEQRRAEIAEAVSQGIAAAVGEEQTQERTNLTEEMAKATAPVLDKLDSLLEKVQWLEEDNQALKAEIAANTKKPRGLLRWFRREQDTR